MGLNSSKKRSFVQANKDLTDPEKENQFDDNVAAILEYLQTFNQRPEQMKVGKEAGTRMLEKSLKPVCDKLEESLGKGTTSRREPHEILADKGTIPVVKKEEKPSFVDNALDLLVLLTQPECGSDVCSRLVENDALLQKLISSVNQDLEKHRSLSILHNLAAYEAELKDGYRAKDGPKAENHSWETLDEKIVLKLKPLTKNDSDKKEVKLLATVALACMRDTAIQRDLLQFMVSNLCLALDDTHHRSHACSATAMERAVRHLLKMDTALKTEPSKAAKDGTKKPKQLLIQYGIVSLMAKGAMSEIDEERTACIDSLWLLCREENCKADMAEDGKLTNLLFDLYKDQSNPFQEQAAFILVNLRDYLKKKPKHLCLSKDDEGHQLDVEKRLQETQQSKKEDQNKVPAPTHVMLSYQTQYRETILEIKHKLEDQGIKTWMDHYDIRKYRDAFEAMADAVERCGVFLMGVSQEYQSSENCKREAEYAITLKKTVIPLKLQKDFQPSSWLGLIQGSQMYYDFAEETDEATRKKLYVDLIAEIKTKMGEASPTTSQKKGQKQATTTSTQASANQSGEGKPVQVKDSGADTKVDTFEKGKDDPVPTSSKSPKPVRTGAGGNGDTTTRRSNAKAGNAGGGVPSNKGVVLRRSLSDRHTPRQQALPYQKPLSVVVPYCRLHPNATCNAKGDGYNHCCCHVEDPRKEVREWLKRYRLDGNEAISSLSKKDLLSLVCLKNEAPDFFYQRIWNDLKMKKFSEIEQFKAALTYWEVEVEN